ncbi:1567_t:CDS:2 [Funneliformis geosporum]|nr:1567_t:CDS:2 [Funneliformis geosporum]
MDEVSTKFNKGYQRPGDTTWHEVETNCENKKSKVLTIDPDFLDDLEIHFLADVARDSNLNPYKLFKEVIVKKLENNVLATIHDEKSVFYRIINPDEIQHEKTLGGGMEKFAYHVEVVGGMIPFTNSQEKNTLQQDLVNLENSIDAQILAQERTKNENLQKALDSLVEVLGKEDIHTLADLKALLQGQTLKNLLTLFQQKHNDLETQLLNLAKQKITKQKQASELLKNQKEQNQQLSAELAQTQEQKNLHLESIHTKEGIINEQKEELGQVKETNQAQETKISELTT